MNAFKKKWEEIFALPIFERHKTVASEVRAALVKTEANKLSTTALVDFLWPVSESEPKERNPLFDVILALKDTLLVDCNERSEESKKIGGHLAYPRLWSKPRAPTHCPTCGRALEAATEGNHPAPEPPSAETPSS